MLERFGVVRKGNPNNPSCSLTHSHLDKVNKLEDEDENEDGKGEMEMEMETGDGGDGSWSGLQSGHYKFFIFPPSHEFHRSVVLGSTLNWGVLPCLLGGTQVVVALLGRQ